MLLLPPKFTRGPIRRLSSNDPASLSRSTIDRRCACSLTSARRGSAHRPSNSPHERCRSKRISRRLERGPQCFETPIWRVSGPRRPGPGAESCAGKRPRKSSRCLSVQRILAACRGAIWAGTSPFQGAELSRKKVPFLLDLPKFVGKSPLRWPHAHLLRAGNPASRVRCPSHAFSARPPASAGQSPYSSR